MRLERSMLCLRHVDGMALWLQAVRAAHARQSPLLTGPLQRMWPLIALTTQGQLGACRHAISQRTVAGVMTVFPPFLGAREHVPDRGGL